MKIQNTLFILVYCFSLFACSQDGSEKTVYVESNSAPVANAGPMQSDTVGSKVYLDGNRSVDPNGDVITYLWKMESCPDGSTAVLDNSEFAMPFFLADLEGNYVFSLVVNDGSASSTPSYVMIQISEGDSTPVADAGNAQSGTVGTIFTLNGTGSNDPNGDPLTFAWTVVSMPSESSSTLNNPNSIIPTFLADVEGTYVFSLTVNDGLADSLPSYVSVAVATENSPPVANAGADQSVNTDTVVNLSGGSSYDADNDFLSYTWSLDSTPAGSSAELHTLTGVQTGFLADVEGVYNVSLVVNDGYLDSVVDTVKITAEFVNSPPVANAGNDQDVAEGSLVSLSGTNSSDANSDPIFYSWEFTIKPEGSLAELSDTTSSTPTFTADVEGIYVIGLSVNDGMTNSLLMDTVTIEAHRAINALDFDVIDAEYNDVNDTIVIVSTIPSQKLHIYNPTSGEDVAVHLVLPPNCVSVSSDGMYAAVGHDGWVSYVNLQTASVEKQLPVSTDVFDIIVAANGYIYAFPRRDQWETIRCLNVSTGEETTSGGYSIRAGTVAKLHPSGQSIYGADNGLSPSDIEKYDISGGTAAVMYDSPYHGDYAMCGDLWIAEDGLRIFTACGNVFRSSTVRNEDMTYNGSLSSLSRIVELDHSAAANQVFAIPGNDYYSTNNDTSIQSYDYDFLAYNNSVTLPKFLTDGGTYSSHGRFVFVDSSGSTLYAIVRADASAGILYDYGITSYLLQ